MRTLSLRKPELACHADWGSAPSKRWCATAKLGTDGCYTASAPCPVGKSSVLLKQLRAEAGQDGCLFVGFDFPIGVPGHYAKYAGVTNFRDFLTQLGSDEWSQFFSVCDEPDQISIRRPFYPNGKYSGRKRDDLLRAHHATSIDILLRICERGTHGQKTACSLFWTLGGNQVGKAAISGWRDVLTPALKEQCAVRLWPFDGKLDSLLVPGNTVVVETYPAECYDWFPGARLRSKADIRLRSTFGKRLLSWASLNNVAVQQELETAIRAGFPSGEDDAFDAVVGLFGMLQVCLGQRAPGEPEDNIIREAEGWILGRQMRAKRSDFERPTRH